jgi:hypothetical protein
MIAFLDNRGSEGKKAMNDFDTLASPDETADLADINTTDTDSNSGNIAISRMQRMSELARAICETTALHVYYLEARKQSSNISMNQKLLSAATLVRESARQLLLEAAKLMTEQTEWWQWLGCECQLHERRVRYYLEKP